ncbi:hypothetical protein [Jongsikchunia kroppenstedtii]|uniref:hypothetical protein n=1 Tax=Jongsikchunia kroppenstedtii TaxID=1121721 RepID=UPI00039D79D0|nr:hypothetical protein [Jongsikchunia kroppenstedtii]
MRGRLPVVLTAVFAVFLMHQGAVGMAVAAPMAMPASMHAQSTPVAGHQAADKASGVAGCEHGHHCVFVRSAEIALAAAVLIAIVAVAIAVDIVGICSRRLRFIAERPPPWTAPTQASLSVFRR